MLSVCAEERWDGQWINLSPDLRQFDTILHLLCLCMSVCSFLIFPPSYIHTIHSIGFPTLLYFLPQCSLLHCHLLSSFVLVLRLVLHSNPSPCWTSVTMSHTNLFIWLLSLSLPLYHQSLFCPFYFCSQLFCLFSLSMSENLYPCEWHQFSAYKLKVCTILLNYIAPPSSLFPSWLMIGNAHFISTGIALLI